MGPMMLTALKRTTAYLGHNHFGLRMRCILYVFGKSTDWYSRTSVSHTFVMLRAFGRMGDQAFVTELF